MASVRLIAHVPTALESLRNREGWVGRKCFLHGIDTEPRQPFADAGVTGEGAVEVTAGDAESASEPTCIDAWICVMLREERLAAVSQLVKAVGHKGVCPACRHLLQVRDAVSQLVCFLSVGWVLA